MGERGERREGRERGERGERLWPAHTAWQKKLKRSGNVR